MGEEEGGKARMRALIDECHKIDASLRELNGQAARLKARERVIDKELMDWMEAKDVRRVHNGEVTFSLAVRERKKPWRQDDLSQVLSEHLGSEQGVRVLDELEARRPTKEQRYIRKGKNRQSQASGATGGGGAPD